jgi:hypothetical protein
MEKKLNLSEPLTTTQNESKNPFHVSTDADLIKF